MPDVAPASPTIEAARRFFADEVLKDLDPFRDAALSAAHVLVDQPAERAVAQARRDMLQDLQVHLGGWLPLLATSIRERLDPAALAASSTAAAALAAALQADSGLQLVDDETIQRNILISRLALAILDKTTWEFADLRARLTQISRQTDLDEDDLFRPQTVARAAMKSWLEAGLAFESWRALETPLHRVFSERLEAAFRETNAWLVRQGVLPQVDLRPFIRRTEGGRATDMSPLASTPEAGTPSTRSPAMPMAAEPDWGDAPPLGPAITRPVPASLTASHGAVPGQGGPGLALRPQGGAHPAGPVSAAGRTSGRVSRSSGAGEAGASGVGQLVQPRLEEETRMMTRHGGGAMMGPARAQGVLGRFSDILEQHLPGFRDQPGGKAPSAQLAQAMSQAQDRLAQQGVAREVSADGVALPAPSPAKLVAELRERQQTLKKAAATPEEKATVELVALLFQSILTDERIPTALRVWFARLQMPVLRVALAEPDFFSGADHPARRLIDRMGACVMGFEGDAELIGTPLEAEIRRVVQVVEAFPDTGRRVFQAVLNEFEKFLERYLRDHHPGARAGVSLAQQIEQRETLAIQYTIELRKMINELEVQEGVRDFLFHIWADVLATTAVRHGPQSPAVTQVREAAAELLWMASAKTNRAERAEVIRKLPALLGTLRQGMSAAGLAARKQDEAIQALNTALTAAFSARATAISTQQLEQLKERLAMIEELLPDDDMELDDAWVLDEANHQHEGIEVIAEGGSMPGPSMLAAAVALQLGSAFTLDYRGRHDTVRLIWQGMHKQLALFSTTGGRCVLFQKTRLAAFLQAGLLVPVEDESLTVTATRQALRKISADPARLSA